MMKKLLLFIFALMAVAAYGNQPTAREKVEVEQTSGVLQKPRSPILAPNVYLLRDVNQVELKLYSTDSYVMRVVDASGTEICQVSIITDGIHHSYSLPLLNEGQYSLAIESSKRTFEGQFDIF